MFIILFMCLFLFSVRTLLVPPPTRLVDAFGVVASGFASVGDVCGSRPGVGSTRDLRR